MNIDQAARHLTAKWSGKTLAEFRDEAEREDTGTVYEAFRVETGPRLMLMMCLTDVDQIEMVERAFEFVDDGLQEDWNSLTLAEVFRRTVLGSGIAFESLRDEYGRRAALVICSTEPQSMQRLNLLFDLPT
jgi:hypothetical protein